VLLRLDTDNGAEEDVDRRDGSDDLLGVREPPDDGDGTVQSGQGRQDHQSGGLEAVVSQIRHDAIIQRGPGRAMWAARPGRSWRRGSSSLKSEYHMSGRRRRLWTLKSSVSVA